eukprot:6203117-Pleurochrysis_carterae.AAC.3
MHLSLRPWHASLLFRRGLAVPCKLRHAGRIDKILVPAIRILSVEVLYLARAARLHRSRRAGRGQQSAPEGECAATGGEKGEENKLFTPRVSYGGCHFGLKTRAMTIVEWTLDY